MKSRLKKIQNRLTGFFTRLSIRKQIFLSLVSITILVSVVLGSVLYEASRKTIEQEYQTAHRESLQVAENILQISLRSIVDEQRNLLTNMDFLSSFEQGEEGKTSFPASQNRTLTSQLSNILFTRSEIREILCVNMSGNILFTSQNDYNQRYIIPYYNGTSDLLSMDWVKACDSAKGKEVFFSENVLFDDNKGEVFSIAKKLINVKDGSGIGYVVFNVRKSSLATAFGGTIREEDPSVFLILDGEDGIVWSSREADEEALEETKEKVKDQESEGKHYVAAAMTDPLTEWTIASVVSRKALLQRSAYVGVVALVLAMLLILVSVWLSSAIARRITRPLNALEKTMKQVAGGNYRVEEEFDESEAGRIGNQFRDLFNNNIDLKNRLLNSRIRERESQLLLLQSQINPHYLYNTLDTLYFMAVIRGEDEIADFVQALSENFKLSLNSGKKLIPVSDELERIRAYMKIQNYRFENRYTLKIDVPEAMQKDYLLTFLLQPLVENAVYHGLEPKPGPGTILVKGQEKDGIMTFTVEDDGVGIKDFKDLDAGYGIRNIRERIRLFYGEEYGVKLENRTPCGTRVTVTLSVLDPQRVKEELESESEEKKEA